MLAEGILRILLVEFMLLLALADLVLKTIKEWDIALEIRLRCSGFYYLPSLLFSELFVLLLDFVYLLDASYFT